MIKQKCLKTIKMISTRFKQWWHPIYVSSLILWFHVLKLNTKYSFLSMCVFEMLLSNQNKIRCRIHRTYEPLSHTNSHSLTKIPNSNCHFWSWLLHSFFRWDSIDRTILLLLCLIISLRLFEWTDCAVRTNVRLRTLTMR